MTPLRFLLSSLRPHGRTLAVLAALAGLVVAASVGIPLLTGEAVDAIQAGELDRLALCAALVAAVGIAAGIVSGALGIVAGRLSLRVETELRVRVYAHLQRVAPDALRTRATGDLVATAIADLFPISGWVGLGLSAMVVTTLTIVLAAVVLFAIQPLLALLAIAPIPVALLAVVTYQRTARPALLRVRRELGGLAAAAQETVEAVAVVRGAGREDAEVERFTARGGAVLAAARRANRLTAVYQATVEALPAAGLVVVVVGGGRLAIEGDLSVVDFAVFYTYLVVLVPAVGLLGQLLGSMQAALAAAQRVLDVLALPEQPTVAGRALPDGPADVVLRDVTVRAPDGRAVVESVDLRIRAGRSVGIIGETGSGKSTIVELVNRLREPAAGDVRVAGTEVGSVDVAALRGAVAAARDDNFLFSGTIAENIAFGRPDASREQVEAAARRAQAHEFIAALPAGYDTVVGDRGIGLSGGQRQRIALARALVTVPRVLVLDNATGNLDAETERQVMEALLHDDAQAPTRLVVGYRAAVLEQADEVLVLDAGRIAERGTHAELMGRSARYRRLLGVDR